MLKSQYLRMYYVALVLFLVQGAWANGPGVIEGGVYDEQTGDPLIAVAVNVDGTELVQFTDVEGLFRFRNVQPGTYTVVATYEGFSPSRVEGVVVTDSEGMSINITMQPAGIQAEMVVTADLAQDSEIGLMSKRQKADTISDALSIEEISRAGGGDAADAMKRMTGASVVGGKYVTIRGLGDRYTSTHLNGVEMPTSDPDVKAFQADLFPTGVLDNITTLKSFTPDKPGNFSGGLIDIGTKRFPSSLQWSVSMSTGWNSNTTGEDILLYDGSGSDWRGQDDGLRELPGIVADTEVIPREVTARRNAEQAQLLDDVTRSFNNVMSGTPESAPIDAGTSLSIGNELSLGDRPLGFIATFSYSRKYNYRDNWRLARWKLTEAVGEAETLINQSDFLGEQGTDKVNWGSLLTLNYPIHHNHKLTGNIIYTQGGESKASYYAGAWPEQFSSDNTTLENRFLQYTERNLTSFQLRGNHHLGDNMDLDWTMSSSRSTQYEPDTRIFTNHFADRVIGGEEIRNYSISSAIYNNPARYFRDLREDGDALQVNFKMGFYQWADLKGEWKIGFALNENDREFTEDRYEYSSTLRYDGDPFSYFGPENIGIIDFNEATGVYTFGNTILRQGDAQGGNYNGEQNVDAYYAMVTLPLNEGLRMVTGARFESTEMFVTNGTREGILDEDDVLPALGFVQTLGENMNLRLNYGRTLARPTLREMAPYANFDFLADGIFAGNPDLQRTLVDNFDLRWEWFPGSGELVAASVFYKDFENPIERSYNIRFASEFGEKTFTNVDEAEVYGLELEWRQRFDHMVVEGDSGHAFSASVNLTLIESEVGIPEEELAFLLERDPNADSTRQLQGQSPYLVNVGINYDNIYSNTSASVFYNVFGERLDEVGIGGAPDSMEQPRGLLDFTFSQVLWQNFNLKLSGKNLLDSEIEVLQEFKGNEFIRSSYKNGRSFSLSISYKN